MSSVAAVVHHVLVTGGVGYIGSHTVLALLLGGWAVTVVDNLSNSSLEALDRVSKLAGSSGLKPTFIQVDLRDYAKLEEVFKKQKFDACIHFAGLKAVGESVAQPLRYYDHNVFGTINLLKLLGLYNCRRLVFSSSATVYGLAEHNPIPETAPLSTTNPYGQTKLVIEGMLRDLAASPPVATPATADAAADDGKWRIVILRYFNPIGAHESGMIGEDPLGIPNNLLPFVMQVAVGRRTEVNVFGSDYPTKDGTGVRDYIHVTDLASGHLAALEHGIFGDALDGKSCDEFNLGSGVGVSVLEVIAAAEKAAGKKIPYKLSPRRVGDISTCFADCRKAGEKLHWKTEKSLEEAVADSWRWQSHNPNGFGVQATETTCPAPVAAAAFTNTCK